MKLAIHPAQSAYLEQLTTGQKVIWHSSMRLLFCYAQQAPTKDPCVVWRHCYPDFDLAFVFDSETGHFSSEEDCPAGIKFWSFDHQLTNTNSILAAMDDAGNIPTLAVLEDLQSWCEMREDKIRNKGVDLDDVYRWLQKARSFLKNESILIPEHVWRGQVLHTVSQ